MVVVILPNGIISSRNRIWSWIRSLLFLLAIVVVVVIIIIVVVAIYKAHTKYATKMCIWQRTPSPHVMPLHPFFNRARNAGVKHFYPLSILADACVSDDEWNCECSVRVCACVYCRYGHNSRFDFRNYDYMLCHYAVFPFSAFECIECECGWFDSHLLLSSDNNSNGNGDEKQCNNEPNV